MLPDGWTIERVAEVAQGPAELLEVDVPVIVDEIEAGSERLTVVGTTSIRPRCLLRFVDLYLVQDDADGWWYMGMARPDGVVYC